MWLELESLTHSLPVSFHSLTSLLPPLSLLPLIPSSTHLSFIHFLILFPSPSFLLYSFLTHSPSHSSPSQYFNNNLLTFFFFWLWKTVLAFPSVTPSHIHPSCIERSTDLNVQNWVWTDLCLIHETVMQHQKWVVIWVQLINQLQLHGHKVPLTSPSFTCKMHATWPDLPSHTDFHGACPSLRRYFFYLCSQLSKIWVKK